MKKLSDLELGKIFVTVGASAFGGWSTTAFLLEEHLVVKGKYLKPQDLRNAVTYAQILPGATQVAIVSAVGYRLKGARGSLLATVCYLVPAISLIMGFAALYFHYAPGANVAHYFNGLFPALAGIILANAYRIGRSHALSPWLWGVAGITLILRYFFAFNPGLLLVAGGGSVVLVFWRRERTSP